MTTHPNANGSNIGKWFAAGLLALAATTAGAQDFPNKPVRVIIPFPAGGLTDVLMRGLGESLSKKWQQPVIVDNRPGANTIIGAQAVAGAEPDGYTLLMANDPTLSSNQYLYNKLPYDPVNDFVPVVNIAMTEQVLVVPGNSPYNTLEEFLQDARNHPGKLDYGSFGVGSKAHLDTEAFGRMAGAKFNHVPYKGVADVMVAIQGGQVDFGLTGVSPVVEHIKSGRMKGLAISSPERRSQMPDVPTFAEKGFPDYESIAWFGLVAPKGTPETVVNKIAADVLEAASQPALQERYITGVGLVFANQDADEFAAFLEKDRKKYAEKIQAAGVKLDY